MVAGAPAIHGEAEQRLRKFFVERPDATLAELAAACGLKLTPKTICKTLQRLRPTRKKKVRRAAERDDPEMRAQREEWPRKTSEVDAARMVVVDQTGVTTQRHRACGRAPKGERGIGTIAERHCQSATLMGGMRYQRRLRWNVTYRFAIDSRSAEWCRPIRP